MDDAVDTLTAGRRGRRLKAENIRPTVQEIAGNLKNIRPTVHMLVFIVVVFASSKTVAHSETRKDWTLVCALHGLYLLFPSLIDLWQRVIW